MIWETEATAKDEKGCSLLPSQPWIPLAVDRDQLLAQRNAYDVDFKDVKGQYQAKRAMEVAVGGGHNDVTGGLIEAILVISL